MVEVALADADYASIFNKTPELAGGVHFEPFAKDEDVGYVFLLHSAVLGAVIESVFEVVGYEVGGFEE